MVDVSKFTPDELARECADSMWSSDNASRALGMKIVDVTSGCAILTMVIKDTMTNGQKNCHGGYIFTLADSAFAFACNSYNQFSVAQNCTIQFWAPARLNDELTATAKERQRAGRTGIYDVSVCNQRNECIAEFRGISRTVKGTHLTEE